MLDRAIFISSNPNQLHIYDPVSRESRSVALPKAPLSLAISPNGIYAAVGQDAVISYVNLSNGELEKNYPVPVVAANLVLDQAWMYVMPSYLGGSVSVRLDTGAVTTNDGVLYGSGGRLNPVMKAIYGTRDGLSPNDVIRYDVATGPITRVRDSIYHGDYPACGPIWISPSGYRIYTGCSAIYKASQVESEDMLYAGTFGLQGQIGTLAENEARGLVGLIPRAASSSGGSSAPTQDRAILIYTSATLQPLGSLALAEVVVNGTAFSSHGRWLFFNREGSEAIAITQADPNSGLLRDYSVQRIALSPPAGCGAQFAASEVEIRAEGTQANVEVESSPSCLYEARSGAPWVRIMSGAFGSGKQTLRFLVRANPGATARSGAITMGGQTYTIRQAGVGPARPFRPLAFNVAGAAYSKALDSLVTISANPPELHIYQPDSREDRVVEFARTPLSVAVSPDGLKAVVGHDGFVSLVDLVQGQVERGYAVVTDVSNIALAGNGYAYLFPQRDWSDIYSLNLASGQATATQAIYNGRVPRMTVDGKFLYLGGNWFSKWDISQGVAKPAGSSYSGISSCGNLWLTEDGLRLITGCGRVHRVSEVPAEDLQYNGQISTALGGNVAWAAHSAKRMKTAAVAQVSQNFGGPFPALFPPAVQLFGDEFLGFEGAIPLPVFEASGRQVASSARWLFWNQAEDKLIAVMRADSQAGLLAEFGVAVVEEGGAVRSEIRSILNAASGVEAAIAPGQVITLLGRSIGPEQAASFQLDERNMVPTTLGSTQVLINNVAAPLLYVSAGQINTIVPYNASPGTDVSIQVSRGGATSPAIQRRVAQTAPGIFTMNGGGTGQAIAILPDGSLNSAANPVRPGGILTLYFTGGGYLNPGATTGSVTPTTGLRRYQQTTTVSVGGQLATVLFSGAAPGFVDGIGQLNIQLGANTPAGAAQPIVVNVGQGSSGNAATIVVQ